MVTGKHNQTVALEVKDLHKRFGPLEVLRGVSLSAHEGDVIINGKGYLSGEYHHQYGNDRHCQYNND